MPADDLTDPAPATTFAHLDAPTVLSRSIAELGIYPAGDPLDSTSRMLDVRIIGEEHYNTARNVQKVLQVRCLASKRLLAAFITIIRLAMVQLTCGYRSALYCRGCIGVNDDARC